MENLQTVDMNELENVEGGILPLIAGAIVLGMVAIIAVEAGYAFASMFRCE